MHQPPVFFDLAPTRRVIPRYRLLRQVGFYPLDGRRALLGSEVECCGAHSPKSPG